MIPNIIRKELLDNLQSRVFVISFAFVLLLSAVCSFILIENFNEKQRENSDYMAQHERVLDYLTPEAVGGIYLNPIRPLPQLNMLFKGIKPIVGIPSIDQDTVPLLFPQTDFFLIIGILMSLMSLLFSFAAISGEKQEGTLRAIFSNPVRRSTLLIGKWIGGIVSLAIPFSACYLLAILVTLILGNIAWTATEWLSLLSIYFLGLIYISMFYLIGLYISARTRQPYISMLVCLLIWAFFILVLPTLPDYLGREFVPAPSAAKIMYENEIKFDEQRWKIINKIKAPYQDKGYTEMEINDLTKEEVNNAIQPLYEQRHKANKDFENKMVAQALVATATAMLSPYASFTLAGNELAATGISNQIHFNNQRQQYEELMRDYIKQRQQKEYARDKTVNDGTQLDLSGRPKFEYKDVPFRLRIIAAAVPTLFLVIFNILFFVLAFRGFLRYDVR